MASGERRVQLRCGTEKVKERPLTHRGALSTIGTFYDPCGFLGPVMLRGKQVLQELRRRKLDWDTQIPADLRIRWEEWLEDVHELERFQVQRCFKPKNFGNVQQVELHHFSDASQEGYGQCSYVRFVNEDNKAHCAFVIGKSRVTPLRQVTIPRLELAAATVSARVSAFLRDELGYVDCKEYFWTDSQVVLGYVKNEAKRFHTFVANRVQLIRDLTNPGDWFYVDTSSNPADDASRGLSAKQLVQDSRWLTGPEFLWRDGIFEAETTDTDHLDEMDPEVKRASTMATHVDGSDRAVPGHLDSSRLVRFSRWDRAKKAVARCLQLKDKLKERKVKRSATNAQKGERRVLQPLSVSALAEAEKVIVRGIQQEYFAEELKTLRQLGVVQELCDRHTARSRKTQMKKSSNIYRLDPYLDGDGLIRVGGRIDRANMPKEVKHPVIVPSSCHITRLVIQHCHERVQHMGRGITHNEIRQSGYWILGGSSAVSQCISSCVECRRRRGFPQQPKMSELPEDRLEPSPPFSYSAVDYFGPFLIKEKRSEVKRYGVIFTCMSSRSVHLETANSLSGSSFINALRRFLNWRGNVRQLRSDQGTTFIGARNELRDALAEMDQTKVQEYLLSNGCDWIPFQLNVPHASHMGGVWERQIQTVRRVLEPLLKSIGCQLDDEAFRTFVTEAEAIINSRPLTTANLNDPAAPEPLTPNHILLMKSKVVLPPPGVFQRAFNIILNKKTAQYAFISYVFYCFVNFLCISLCLRLMYFIVFLYGIV